jgi:hypothetical protein
VNLAPRIAALETRIPFATVPMDAAEARALWDAMEAEEPEPDLSWLGLTAHEAWARYKDCLNA